MLKKAGIVVATVAAGLLAVSPLAFAGEAGNNHHKGHDKDHKSAPAHYTKYDHSPRCESAPQDVTNYNPQAATGVSSLIGILGIGANVLGPVTAQLQTPILSCNNLENIANVNIHDNLNDNG